MHGTGQAGINSADEARTRGTWGIKRRVRQNGAHQARRERKDSVFGGKFYLSCMRFFFFKMDLNLCHMVFLTDTECL